MFKQAIVRLPGKSVVKGISSAGQGKPDYAKLMLQHARYISVLESCGLEVHILLLMIIVILGLYKLPL